MASVTLTMQSRIDGHEQYCERLKWLYDHCGPIDSCWTVNFEFALDDSDLLSEIYQFDSIDNALLFKLTWAGNV